MTERTQSPIVTGGSVVALKYAGGILVATDTLCSYGSLARYPDLSRMKSVGMSGDTLLAAGGDYSDYQQILKMIEMRATHEFALDDGASMAPAAMHHWLTRVLYQRRSKMDPLWNSLIVAGFRNGQSYLGTSDLYGTMYTDDFIATGLGAHMALPLLRKSWRADLTETEARKILEDSMRVLFYRDTRAGSKIQIGKVDGSGCSVDEPHQLETFWEHPEFVRGGGHLGDGSW
jgi:20S proteasome subunit beta 7